MKSAVIYSSLTGNTKSVAGAILKAMPERVEIFAIKDAPPPDAYDLLALGFWVSKSGPEPKMAAYMERVRGKNLILFGTMAGYPASEYGERVRANSIGMAESNRVLGVFLCQGRIAEKRFQAYMNGELQNSRHPLTPERKERLVEASRHPNEADFVAAQAFVMELLRRTDQDDS